MATPAQQQTVPASVNSFLGAVAQTATDGVREILTGNPKHHSAIFNEQSGASHIGFTANFARAPLLPGDADAKPVKPDEFSSKDMDTDAGILRAKSGNTIAGGNTIYDAIETQQVAKEKRDREETANAISQALSLTQFTSSLGQFANFQQAMATSYAPREVAAQEMLYVDANGKMVSADVPGAKLAQTAEDLASAEAARNQTLLKLTQEDITQDSNGNLVNKNDFMIQQTMLTKVDETQGAIAKLESGELKMEQLPKETQDSVTYWQKNGDELTKIMDKPEDTRTPEDRKVLAEAQRQFMGNDLNQDIWARGTPNINDPNFMAPAPAPDQPAPSMSQNTPNAPGMDMGMNGPAGPSA